VGRFPSGIPVGPVRGGGGGSCLNERNIFFEPHMGPIKNLHLGRHFAYHLVPVLAVNYKQHILSPSNVIKV
jgi:hypothetical protein